MNSQDCQINQVWSILGKKVRHHWDIIIFWDMLMFEHPLAGVSDVDVMADAVNIHWFRLPPPLLYQSIISSQ